MNFKKSLLAFVFTLSPLMINGGPLNKDPIPEEELKIVRAIEQAILNMSPKEQEDLAMELETALYKLPNDVMHEVLEYAARCEQELIRLYPK